MANEAKLCWFKMMMIDAAGKKMEVDYVMPSQDAAVERWRQNFRTSSWKLDYVRQIYSLDGQRVSFG